MTATPQCRDLGPEWIEVGRLEDLPRRGARVLRHPEGDIALFRTSDDEVFALRDRCPHRGGPLSQGIVHGRQVTCPLHDWRIRLADGRAVAPDEGCAPCYATRVVDGRIYLDPRPRSADRSCGE